MSPSPAYFWVLANTKGLTDATPTLPVCHKFMVQVTALLQFRTISHKISCTSVRFNQSLGSMSKFPFPSSRSSIFIRWSNFSPAFSVATEASKIMAWEFKPVLIPQVEKIIHAVILNEIYFISPVRARMVRPITTSSVGNVFSGTTFLVRLLKEGVIEVKPSS
jgi:hypothetical protein